MAQQKVVTKKQGKKEVKDISFDSLFGGTHTWRIERTTSKATPEDVELQIFNPDGKVGLSVGATSTKDYEVEVEEWVEIEEELDKLLDMADFEDMPALPSFTPDKEPVKPWNGYDGRS